MIIKTAKFGVAVKIGKHGAEINFAQSDLFEMTMEGMFLKLKQKFGEKKVCLVCVTNIAFMEVDEQVSNGSLLARSEKARATKAKNESSAS